MGTVYLLCEVGSNPERYKIGITKSDPKSRIKQLQTGCSNEIVLLRSFDSEHYTKIEKTLHREYSVYLTTGGTEWFQLPSEKVFQFPERCKTLDNNFSILKESENPFFK